MRPITHGTTAGYRAHYRRSQQPCTDCKAAYDVGRPERNAAARAKKAADLAADEREYGPPRFEDPLPIVNSLRFLSESPQALCGQTDPDIFTPQRGRPDLEKAAKKVCQGCELRWPCLEASLQNKATGVWGGTTARERRKLLRETRAA